MARFKRSGFTFTSSFRPAIVRVDKARYAETAKVGPAKKRRLVAFPDEAISSVTSPKKKAKAAKSQNTAASANLPELSLDVLLEILKYVNPSDLLQLSRTTKAIRSLLLSPASKHVWRAAIENSKIAPCPEYIAPPRYVSLMIEESLCHFCHCAKGVNISWYHGFACCMKCLAKHFERQSWPTVEGLQKQVPFLRSASSFWRYKYFLKSDLEELRVLIAGIESPDAFLAERERFFKNVDLHAIDCWRWQYKEKQKALERKRDARTERYKSVVERLSGLGWKDEIESLEGREYTLIKQHPLINQTKKLTDRIWSNIAPALIEFLEESRATRIRDEYIEILEHRMFIAIELVGEFNTKLTSSTTVPGNLDVIFAPEFRSIIEVPVEDDITVSSFDIPMSRLADIYSEWRTSSSQFLIDLVPMVAPGKKGKAKANDESCLELATTFFRCKWCREPITYPRILEHACLSDVKRRDTSIEDPFVVASWSLAGVPWNYDRQQVTFDDGAHDSAKEILRVCGEDPMATTTEEMDVLDDKVECVRCLKGNSHLIMNWRAAIEHDLTIHLDELSSGQAKWKLVKDENLLAISEKKGKGARGQKRRKNSDRTMTCKRCKMRVPNMRRYFHAVQFHGLKGDQLASYQTDFTVEDNDAPFTYYRAVRIEGQF